MHFPTSRTFSHISYISLKEKKKSLIVNMYFPVHVIPEKQKWIHFTMGTCLQMLEIKTFFMDHQIHYNATL